MITEVFGKCIDVKINIIVFLLLFNTNLLAQNFDKVYFGGGCFWCMEDLSMRLMG